jgi:LysM repeat protein
MLKRIIPLLLLFLASASTHAQMRQNSAYQAYIRQYKDLAVEQMMRYGIPASITLAQGLFESGAGQSALAVSSNNHFGIKCHGWTGRKVYHDDDASGECFRAYDNPRQSYEDHSKFLANNVRYASLFRLSRTDYRGWARGLRVCGYATNPAYADRLIGIIELYGLNQYDMAKSYDHFMVKRSSGNVVGGQTLHKIYMYNDNYYLYVRSGDTFRSIGKEVGISWRKIAKYNELTKRDVLHVGDILYLKKKRRKAERKYKNVPHVVKDGESMYSIAQRYAIRLKSLYKKNGLDPRFYQIQAGDRLRVY